MDPFTGECLPSNRRPIHRMPHDTEDISPLHSHVPSHKCNVIKGAGSVVHRKPKIRGAHKHSHYDII